MVIPQSSANTWAIEAQHMVDVAPELEELGYESIYCFEHHFQRDGHLPSPLMTLAALAAVTERVRLGSNVLLVPLYNPVKLAEDTAVLDILSRGRLVLGVAPGYVSEEFAGLMVPYEERFARFEEALDLITVAWTEETFSFEGRFFRVPETRLSPKPLQSPHPPIWYGVSGPRLLRRAAARHCVLVASPRHTIPELREQYGRYEAAAADFGFTPPERPCVRNVFVADTQEKAEAIAGPAILHNYRELYGRKSAEGARALRTDDGQIVDDVAQVEFEALKSRCIVGTPEYAYERIAELRDEVGVTEVACWMHLPGVPVDQTFAAVRLFAEEVIPALKNDNA